MIVNLIQKISGKAGIGRLSAAVVCMAAASFCAYGGDIIGKVVVGYQGWLSAPNDGSAVNKWKHTNMECWPDVREYTTTYSGCTFYQAGVLQSAFNGNLGNGQPAKLFSNWNDQTVNKHFEWMRDYGIDCAAVQRFGSELKDSAMKAYRDGIASKVKTAAQTYGRKYYIMYDISGWDSFQAEIKTDWSNVMRSHTNSSAYAKENGKPVVCVWGIGFSDRPGNVTAWTDVVNWFKGQGCYVIGGVSGKFDTDTVNKNAYKACHMLMSWRVGSKLDPYSVFAEELAWCNSNGVAYQGDIYPGTAFYNTEPSGAKNRIPRQHGEFMWKQFAAAKNKGIHGIYISMFDEVQEATQIFKTAENLSQIPAGKYFLTLNADEVDCSSDFYLRLTQDGGKMFKGQIGYTTSHPTAHVVSSLATVPWVTNLTLSAAGISLTNAGLAVGSVSSNYHSTVAAGKIFSQTPGGGTSVARGSSVALAVSLGPQPSGVPSVGSIITLKAVNGKYVSATYSTNNALIANKTTLSNYERFKVINATNCVALQCIGNSKFVSIDTPDGSKPMLANRPAIGSYEKFSLVQFGSQIAIQSVRNTNYISAVSNGVAPLRACQTYVGSYEKFTWKVE
jgi:hypothetical protein